MSILLERVWFQRELNKVNETPSILDSDRIHKAYHEHPSSHHRLFDYLHNQANETAMRFFLQNDSIVNIEFFDYLALTIVGTEGAVKKEIIENMWSEAGYGHVEKFHTTLFQHLLKEMSLTYNKEEILNSMGWEALAGLNLFYFLTYNSYNKIRLFGAMAATELLDPPHYAKFSKGMRRVFGNKYDLSYYSHHEEVDIIHADGWINEVILGTLHNLTDISKENFIEHFWQGFMMRLNSANLYYNYLLRHISKEG